MKLLLPIPLVVLLGIANATAATLTPGQFRKFHGLYTGPVSGIAGNTGGSGQVGPFTATITVSSKSSEILTPMLSGLYVAPTHRIVWRKPTGSTKRAVLVGVYVGTFTNVSGVQYAAKGTRKIVLVDRGSGTAKRYAAALSDDLAETFVISGATVAAGRFSGNLVK